jgi:exopolysaccharide biosynthesis polyprenyl glycosylphosphotransferase
MRGMEDGAAVAGVGVDLRSQRSRPSAADVTVSHVPRRRRRTRRATLELLGGSLAALASVAALGHLGPVVVLGVAAWAFLANQRTPSVAGPQLRQVTCLFRACGAVLAGSAVLTALGVLDLAAETGLVLAVAIAPVVASVIRLVEVHRAGPVRTLLVGDLMSVSQWSSQWRNRRGVKVVGALVVQPDSDLSRVPHDLLGVPVSTSLDDLAARVELHDADLVAFAPSPGITDDLVRRASWQLEDSRAATAMLGLFDGVAPSRISPGVVGGATLCELEAPRRSGFVVATKHLLDRVAAALGLLAVAPLLGLLAVAIRLDSRGPVIFKQVRVGRHGVPFTVYKLRTMVSDAEEVKHRLAERNEFDGVLFKMKHDPRITRLGRFLRTSSLDELPQLFNVLRGEMSLIGPRPFLPSETAEMSSDQLRRLAVRPGITGLWQVSGRSDLGWEESVALDTYYADNWTLAGDAQIAARTVSAVLGARGAY